MLYIFLLYYYLVAGMNIEDVAEETPDAIIKEPIDITEGLDDAIAQRVAAAAGFYDKGLEQAVDTMKKLYNLFIKYDATMLEINPMAEDRKGNGEISLLPRWRFRNSFNLLG